VFLIAGVAKVAARSGRVLPWIEIALGGLLVAQIGLPFTGWVAAGLLVAFTGWLLTHQGVPCACFGAASRRPADWRDIARNIALIAVALVAIAQH
jgi:hypothetical protein